MNCWMRDGMLGRVWMDVGSEIHCKMHPGFAMDLEFVGSNVGWNLGGCWIRGGFLGLGLIWDEFGIDMDGMLE